MPENNQRKANLLKRLLNTRKNASVPKGTASVKEVRKLLKNAPLSPEETLNQLKKLGFAGGRGKTRRLGRRRFARRLEK